MLSAEPRRINISGYWRDKKRQGVLCSLPWNNANSSVYSLIDAIIGVVHSLFSLLAITSLFKLNSCGNSKGDFAIVKLKEFAFIKS